MREGLQPSRSLCILHESDRTEEPGYVARALSEGQTQTVIPWKTQESSHTRLGPIQLELGPSVQETTDQGVVTGLTTTIWWAGSVSATSAASVVTRASPSSVTQ